MASQDRFHIGLEALRDIPKEAGVITHDIVEELKQDLLDEIFEDITKIFESNLTFKWHIDSEERTISCAVDCLVVG